MRLSGGPTGSTASNVRVFFRMFLTQSNDTDFQPTTTYASNPDAQGRPGSPVSDAATDTIPFFATGNYPSTNDYASLAIMKWRLSQTAPSDRWYPVLQRYISYLAGRVNGLGGNAGSIEPSPLGVPPRPAHVHVEHTREFTGKVSSIGYDRFGDFDGFRLLSEDGCEHTFRSREHAVEDVVRCAWRERDVITVIVHRHELHVPVSIVLRRAPRLH